MRDIKDIEHELTAAHARVRELADELYEARCELAGIRPGDIVRGKPGPGSRRGYTGLIKVSKVDTLVAHNVWIHGHKQKKNGEWFVAEQWFGPYWEPVT